MAENRPVIALVAAGRLGKYVVEELLADPRYDVVVISRSKPEWFLSKNISVYTSDYSEDSVLSILNNANAKVLISLMSGVDGDYVKLHTAYLNACSRSTSCKRFIPSEYAGNIEDFPLLPDFYVPTRLAFREVLKEHSTAGKDVEWTLFNVGWFADYFLPESKSYFLPLPDDFPIDPNNWKAQIRGTGHEVQSWICAREAARALVELLGADEWENVTYVAAEWNTFNEALKIMEKFYGRKMPVEWVTEPGGPDKPFDKWMLSGAAACPREKTLRQKTKYFSKVKFSTLEELLGHAAQVDFV